jgi:hypothetical protein
MQFSQCLYGFAGFCKRVNKNIFKKVLTTYCDSSMISVSIRKGGRQVQTVVLESTEKFLKQQIKLFQKSFKKYLTQPNSCGKVQSSTRAQLVE